jgi:hypothetical protein
MEVGGGKFLITKKVQGFWQIHFWKNVHRIMTPAFYDKSKHNNKTNTKIYTYLRCTPSEKENMLK